MNDHELNAWLGDVTVTDEQRAALHRAADMTTARYPHPDQRGDAETAFTAASQLILGDATLTETAATYAAARRAEREAMAALTGAMIAASATTREAAISRETGMNRMTVRKAIGK